MRRWTRTLLGGALSVAVMTAAGIASPAIADPSPSRPESPGKSEDPDYRAAVKAIDAGNFAAAIPLLEGVVARDAKNADAYNWLGYAVRRSGDPKRAIPFYQKALAIDPKHREAHEYIGEAYLLLDDVAKAKEHLAVLDKLCFLPCEQYSDLKKAVDAYEKSGGKTKPRAEK